MTFARIAALLGVAALANAENIVIIGDSWGTEGNKAFREMLKDHNSQLTVENIAVSGSTTVNWLTRGYTEKIEKAVSKPDVKVVWLTLMGNDAKNNLPACGRAGGSSDECTQKIVDMVTPNMETILGHIHNNSKPDVRVVGFGYDILGCAKGNGICDLVPHALYPRCNGDITCFNTQFLALQGSIQAAAGDVNASVGHPDLAKFSPTQYMQNNCIHPKTSGFAFIFSNMWNMYLHKYN